MDLIDRQAALGIVNDIRDCVSVNGYWAITERLKKLPPAQERKKGEWIRLDEYPNDVSVKCSECGVTLEDWMLGAFYNFCPNCGSEMRLEEIVADMPEQYERPVERKMAELASSATPVEYSDRFPFEDYGGIGEEKEDCDHIWVYKDGERWINEDGELWLFIEGEEDG